MNTDSDSPAIAQSISRSMFRSLAGRLRSTRIAQRRVTKSSTSSSHGVPVTMWESDRLKLR